MNSSSDLYFLIKSMSSSEKRNFKKVANQYVKGKKNNYVRLFDYLNRQPEYDHKKFKKECESKGIVKNYAAGKNYLLKKLLIFLSSTQSQTAELNFHHERLKVIILFQRGLYDAGFRKLNEIKRKRIKNERFASALETVNQMLRIKDEQNLSRPQSYWKGLHKEKGKLIDYLSVQNEMSDMSKNAEELVLSCIFEKPQPVMNELSNYARRADELNQQYPIKSIELSYYLIKALHAYLNDDLQKTKAILEKGKKYWLKQSKDYQKRYLPCLLKIADHLMTLSLKLKDETAFNAHYKFSSGLIKKFQLNEVMRFDISVRPILFYHKIFSNRENFKAYLLKSESTLSRVTEKLSEVKNFLISYSLGIGFFSIKQYDHAFTHFHHCNNSRIQLSYLKELLFFSKIFCAIIHQENGNKSHVQSEFQRLFHILKSRPGDNSVPIFLAKTFKQICLSSNRNQIPPSQIGELVKRLNYIGKFHNNCIYLGLDELRCWAEDIIQKKQVTRVTGDLKI